MARKSAHTLLREFERPDGGRFAVASTGITLRRTGRGAEARWNRSGHLKVDLTLAELDALAARKGWKELARSYHYAPDFVPNPANKAAQRAKAADRAKAKRDRIAAEGKAVEEALFVEGLAGLPATITYVARCCKAERRPHLGLLRYIYDMARFHGGATGGYLGTAIGASYHLDKPTKDQTDNLDLLADIVALVAYGTNTAAATAWRKALLGA